MNKILIICLCLCSWLSVAQNKEIDSLNIELAFKDSDSSKVDTSISIIKLLYKNDEFDKASNYIKLSEQLSKTLNYTKGLATITYYKALLEAKNNNYVSALDNYSKAKSLFTSLEDTLNIARVNSSIGLIQIERGNFKDGLKYALSATKELEALQLNTELSDTYKSIADAYFTMGDHKDAIDFYTKSLTVDQTLADAKALQYTHLKLAEIYTSKQEPLKAIEHYKKALIDVSEQERSMILPKIGAQYLSIKDYNLAYKQLKEAVKLNRKLNNTYGLLTALNSLGDYSIQKRKYVSAKTYLFEATRLTKNVTKEKPEVLKNYKLRKTLDSAKGNYKLAFIWQQKYYQLKEQLKTPVVYQQTNANAASTSAIIEEKNTAINDANAKATLLAEKELESTLKQKRLDRLSIFFIALAAGFIFLAITLLLWYLKRRNRIKYTKALELKTVEIEQQKEEILEQTKHLEDINNVKDKLFSIVSHDLKDSITSINAFINLLKDGTLSQDEFYDLIPELSDNASNASLLLFNLLNWSKSQMNSLKPNPIVFNIQDVFIDKIKLIEHNMNRKGIKLNNQSIRDFVYADKSMVEIVIQNLLTNSVKFCKSGDAITISNHASNGNSIISVSDTGVGISEENQAKLFKSSSFTTTGTGNEKGTGLGLTICKELVELNYGKIWVDSTPNIGSTFYIELPKTKIEEEAKKKIEVIK